MITRRLFFGTAAGVCVARDHLVLEAIAAETMPRRMVVRGVERAPFFELREYADPSVARIFERRGLRCVLRENGRFLFAFPSLGARERAWREVAADPEWPGMRVVLRDLAVFKTRANSA